MSKDVKSFSATIPVSKEFAEDLKWLRWQSEAMFSRSIFAGDEPLTDEERETGWRSFTDSSGTTDRYAVGWRAEQQRKESDARREVEMAACPYVACTCGWHDEE